ncbi:MAG: hypothetical protein JNG89_20590 [Planctomycetaceae bacterium]|nr:hypothetical protein [Planctomycetaceae bacterium]
MEEKDMPHTPSFENLLEAAQQLSVEEQEALIEVVRRCRAERRRIHMAVDIADARREFANNECRAATPDELLAEIMS